MAEANAAEGCKELDTGFTVDCEFLAVTECLTWACSDEEFRSTIQ